MMAYQYYPYYQQPQQPQQMQNGFISARTVDEAFNWPVAPGNSLTFKIENQPFVCTKTKGFSPLEQPTFEIYRLVKEEAPAPEAPKAETNYEDQFKQIWDEINTIKSQIEKPKRTAKKEETNE